MVVSNLLKLTQEETANLNKSVISKEIKVVIKKPSHKRPGLDAFTGEFY